MVMTRAFCLRVRQAGGRPVGRQSGGRRAREVRFDVVFA
jgi:hypothetical protein